jgi:hypothetical protein
MGVVPVVRDVDRPPTGDRCLSGDRTWVGVTGRAIWAVLLGTDERDRLVGKVAVLGIDGAGDKLDRVTYRERLSVWRGDVQLWRLAVSVAVYGPSPL